MTTYKKTTDELKNEILQTNEIESFFGKNEKELADMPLDKYVSEIIAEKKLKKSEIIKGSGMNRIYAYQIFSGKRIPSRDKLIALAFGLQLNIDQTDKLLKHAGFQPLYARSKRDAIIISVMNRGKSVYTANEQLYESGFDILTT